MELKHLHSFVAVAQERNFTRAAERLHIAQPPLSQRIRALEEELGVQLFERNTRKVALTKPGQVFLEETEKALYQLSRAVEACQRTSKGEIGHLRLGYSGGASHVLLPRLLLAFWAKFPDVELDLDGPYPSGVLRSRLIDGEIDVALCFLQPGASRTVSIESDNAPQRGGLLRESQGHSGPKGREASEKWVAEGPLQPAISESDQLLADAEIESRGYVDIDFVLMMPSGHRLAGRDDTDLSDFAAEPFVAYPAGKGFLLRAAMDAQCARAGFSPRVVRESPTSQVLMCLVAAGVGVSIVPQELQDRKEIGGLAFKSLGPDALRLAHGMAWRRNNTNPALRNLISLDLLESAAGTSA